MSCKLSILAACIIAVSLHAATPEAAMNAVRVPNADSVVVINVAKINASASFKHASFFYETLLHNIAHKNGITDQLEKVQNILKTENLTLADVKTFAFYGSEKKRNEQIRQRTKMMQETSQTDNDRSDTEKSFEPLATPVWVSAILLEKPLKPETFKKLATAIMQQKPKQSFISVSIEVMDKSVRRTDGNTSYLIALLGDDKVIYSGDELSVKAAIRRAEADRRAGDLPLMETLLDDKLTQRDLYVASIRAEYLNPEYIPPPLYFVFKIIPNAPESIRNAAKAFTNSSISMDFTDKQTATINVNFDAPEPAAVFGDFLSGMGISGIKTALNTLAGVNMPLMETLKTSTDGKTVSLTCEISMQDIDILERAIEN